MMSHVEIKNIRKETNHMKSKAPYDKTCELPITGLEDVLRDKSLSVIGVIGDKHQGKSILLYNMIHIIQQDAPETHIVGFRLSIHVPGVLHLNTLLELSKVRNSYVIVDELKTIVDTENRTDMQTFLEILQTIRHANNTLILSGLAHNFNGKISGELDAAIFKQTTLISIIKRSNLDYILRPLRSEGKAAKNKFMLNMPTNGALVYHPQMKKEWHYIEIPYLKEYDSKKDNEPVIKWIKGS